jgi:hypothetical protein
VELPYSTVHGIVRYELGAKPKAPRPSHQKKPARASRISGRATQSPFRPGGGPTRAPVLPGRVPDWSDANYDTPDYSSGTGEHVRQSRSKPPNPVTNTSTSTERLSKTDTSVRNRSAVFHRARAVKQRLLPGLRGPICRCVSP